MRFTISILALNNLELTTKCIESVFAAGSDKDEAEMILTNNGSTDGTREYFDELAKTRANVRVIHNDTNLGYQEPNKRALEMAQGEFLVLLNNDCEVKTPGWLKTLAAPFDKNPKAAISGPMSCSSRIMPTCHGQRSRDVFEYIEFSTACLKVSLFRKIGLWIPGIKFAYGDDSSTCLMVRELGYDLHLVPIDVIHSGGKTSRFVPNIKEIQEANHAVIRTRFKKYLTTRRFDYPIVLKRTGAMGDCLLLTPVIAALREQKPLSPIYVETNCPDIFANNPNVVRAASRIKAVTNELRINLDGSYEAEPDRSFVATYASRCGVQLAGARTALYCCPADRIFADAKLQGEGWIAIHAGPVNWENKQWPLDRWAEVSANLQARGKRIVLVGSESRDKTIPCDADLRGKTTIQQLAACLANCELAITLDSFPMHAAQAVGTPIVALFGVTLPGPILTDGSPWIAVQSDANHPGTGIRHRIKNKVFTPTRNNPMETITVEQVLNGVGAMLAQLAKPAAFPEAFD